MRSKKMVLKKRAKKLMFLVAVVLFVVPTIVVVVNWFNDTKIDRILESKSYSYLPVEAKSYIKEVYEETGDIVLTEKNKKVNMPYLNSQYVSYLTLSDEEKSNVGYIPDVYVFDYYSDKTYEATLPSYFNIANYNGNSYVSNTTNQGSLGICWVIAAVENVESLLMWKDKKPFDSSSAVFSSRQFDYATSTNGMYYTKAGTSTHYLWDNANNGYRELGQGGDFYLASTAMSNGITLTDESVIYWNENLTAKKPEEVLNYTNSKYEVLSTVQLPQINADFADSETIDSYVNTVKNYVYQYGSVFVGTVSPQTSCGFRNTDGTYAMKTDDCYSVNTDYGHAMQLIGWDDNYEYTYCDNGISHSSYNGSCASGTKVTDKGAWILRNSWGDETGYKYVYLTYDSTRVSIGFVREVARMSDRKWDNNYYTNPYADGFMHLSTGQSLTIDTKMETIEKVEQVKFHSLTQNGSYKITITSGKQSYSKTITTDEVGIYTVNFNDKNILISDSNAVVTIEGVNESRIVYETLSLFTSNVDEKPQVKTVYSNKTKVSGVVSDENPLHIQDKSTFISMTHFTKNIPAGAQLQYKLFKGDEEYTGYFFGSTSATSSPTPNSVPLDGVISNSIEAGTMYWSDKVICGVTFRFQILYNGEVLEEFPLKRHCDSLTTTSTIYYHSNDERNVVANSTATDLTNIQFLRSDGSVYYNIGSTAGQTLFRPDKHIVSWNTKADGTGTTYKANELYVYGNNHLYAQWADGHQYGVDYYCSYSDCGSVSTVTENISYGESLIIKDNTFTNLSGKTFLHWHKNGEVYYPEESVVDMGNEDTPYNNDESATLSAVWGDSYKTISFNANGGSGIMSSIKMDTSKYSRIKYNLFTKKDVMFDSWNTEPDGTGLRYLDASLLKPTEDMTLYAQWKYTEYKVNFNANGGSGSMSQQIFEHTVSEMINTNAFVKNGYTFVGWNTKADGTGTSYLDQQSVVNITDKEETITLYAQWKANTYIVTYDSNGGDGSMSNQTMTYDKESNLSSNTFTKEGYNFSSWNTKKDGTGIRYTNGQKVKNLIATGVLKLYAQWNEKPVYEIDTYAVDDNNKMIEAISVNTTVEDFKKNIIVGTDYKVEVDSKTLEGNKILYTGGKTKIYKGNELVVEYTNVVLGDVNGDGEINSADLFRIRQHLLSIVTLKDEFFKASDVNKDIEINSGDLFRTRQHLLGIIEIG